MIRRPPAPTLDRSSAASDLDKGQAQNKANAGTTALGELARGLDKTGLFNKLVQGNNIIQNESGIDPQAAAVANPSGPTYTPPPPDPFMVNTLYNPLSE